MTVSLSKLRNKIEATIVRAIIGEAIRLGYGVSVDCGDDDEAASAIVYTDRSRALAECASTDEDRIYFHQDGKCVGGVWIIYGEGATCMTDWHDTPAMNEILAKAIAIVDKALDG
jgi:hypothetical protein